MNPTAIYSKSGKGVQEASGKTSLLQRADRAVLSAIDGRATLADVAQKVGKSFDAAFQTLVTKLDKDGFIREVSAGASAPGAAAAKPAAKPAATPPKPTAKSPDVSGGDLDFSSLGGASKPASPASRPAAPPPKPAAPAAPNFSQLDFSTLGTPSKPATPPPAPAAPAAPGAAKQQQSALTKAREEAEARQQADRDRIKAEAEAKTRTELEAKMRSEAEKKMKDEAAAKEAAAAKAAAEAAAQAKAAKEAALKAAEAKVKAEAEAKAKIEAERKAREEMEKRLEQERKAREESERKAKEEAERVRKEAEERARREREEMEKRLEAERKAREEAERKAKEEAERARRELEEERKRMEAERKRDEEERAERRKREEEEAEARRKQRDEEDRRADEERASKRKQREDEETAERDARRQKEEDQAAALLAAAEARNAQPPKKPESFGDSLLADLDSFTNRDEEERKAKEEEDRKAKAAAEQRRREEEERQAQEEAEHKRAAEEERHRQEEEARRVREEEERRAKEEERRKREAEEIRRKAAEATAAAMAKEGRAAKDDDIPISDDDLAMDEVKKEQAALAKTQAKEQEEQKKREKAAQKAERRAEAESIRIRKPVKWGKLISTTLVVVIVLGLVAIHVMPAPVGDYERSAAEALGRPVKIGSGHYWLLTGPEIRFSDVRIGDDVRIADVSAGISPASLFGDRKEFTRVELDGLRLPQESLAEALFATVKAENLAIDRIVVKSLELPGPAVMPKSLQADAQLDGKGALRTATLRGPDGLVARITPKDGGVEFDVVAGGFTLPIAPEITLSKFAMKGSATPRGMKVDEWGGQIFNGGISGTASIRWGGTWTVDGVLTVRGINAAVFAPALLSNGTGEGTGRFSMSGAEAAKLASTGRIDGNFTVSQGTLGSFDLAKGIQTNGKQALGTTSFTEMTGQASYDRGAIALRNVNIGAGALNAAVSADIAQGGALSGRIVADVKNAGRSQSAVINLGGTIKEPQVRN